MFLDDIPQLQVCVLVSAKQLTEYDDENTFPAKNHKTKYIEAEEGRQFAVAISTPSSMAKVPQDCVAAYISFDGKEQQGRVIETGNKNAGPLVAITGVERNTMTGSTHERFRFARLQTSE